MTPNLSQVRGLKPCPFCGSEAVLNWAGKAGCKEGRGLIGDGKCNMVWCLPVEEWNTRSLPTSPITGGVDVLAREALNVAGEQSLQAGYATLSAALRKIQRCYCGASDKQYCTFHAEHPQCRLPTPPHEGETRALTQYQRELEAEFESVWNNNPALVPLDKRGYGKYICIITAVAWESFLAGKATRQLPAAEREALAEAVIVELDEYGRDVDGHDYGLPIFNDTHMTEMKRRVVAVIESKMGRGE